MARRTSSFFREIAKAQRAQEKRAKTLLRAQEQAVKELEKKRIQEQRAKEQLAKVNAKATKEFEKEQAKLYTESRIAEVELKNAELEDKVMQLNALLSATLLVDDHIDLKTLKRQPVEIPFYAPVNLTQPNPKPVLYMPTELTSLQKLIPGAKGRYQQEVEKAKEIYDEEMTQYKLRENQRETEILRLRKEHESKVNELKEEVQIHNAEIDKFINDMARGQNEALIKYFALVLETSVYPDDFPQQAKIAYVPESKQLVIEYDLPSIDVVPEINNYKYSKAKDEITTTSRPITQRKTLYTSIVAQLTLRTIHELFEADRWQHIETIVFNGYVETIDKGRGRDMRICLVSVRTSRDNFLQIDLKRVDPEACLKTLNATVSKSPAELAPVRPVLEFSMVDPRFVEEVDVISVLDQRTNLMELSPTEFESLITNLFQKMGLESRQTQASRDGGVDCVAFDPRPIFGGKVIIQAKRYKNTVGVSAVRDLFGTLQNEGASKGILITTSGYGKAAYEFADGKPLELLSGSNLLHLLQEHAGIEAKIEIPIAWKDPSPDREEADNAS